MNEEYEKESPLSENEVAFPYRSQLNGPEVIKKTHEDMTIGELYERAAKRIAWLEEARAEALEANEQLRTALYELGQG